MSTITVTLYSNSKRLHEIFANYQTQPYRWDTEKDMLENLFVISCTLSDINVSLSHPRENTYIIQTGNAKNGIEYTIYY